MRKKIPKIAPSPCVTLREEDWATAIGNMHEKLVMISHVIREICLWIERLMNTQTCSLQYFTTLLAGKVITIIRITGKWDKVQRVARPAWANLTSFLSYLQTGYASDTYRMTLKKPLQCTFYLWARYTPCKVTKLSRRFMGCTFVCYCG